MRERVVDPPDRLLVLLKDLVDLNSVAVVAAEAVPVHGLRARVDQFFKHPLNAIVQSLRELLFQISEVCHSANHLDKLVPLQVLLCRVDVLMMTDTSGDQDEIEVGELDVFGVCDIARACKAREVVHGDGRIVGSARVIVKDIDQTYVVLEEQLLDLGDLSIMIGTLLDDTWDLAEPEVLIKALLQVQLRVLAVLFEHGPIFHEHFLDLVTSHRQVYSLYIIKPLLDIDPIQENVCTFESDDFIVRREENRAFLPDEVEIVEARWHHLGM